MLAGLFSAATRAAENCPVLVQRALSTMNSACESTQRNEICYGHPLLKAEPRIPAVTLEHVGDRQPVLLIQTLETAPMDAAQGVWGVALLRLQASLPDALPGQNITMLVMGQAQVDNAVPLADEVPVTIRNRANVRQVPSTSGAVLRSLAASTTLSATGSTIDRNWVRVRTTDGLQGWIFAELLSGDLAAVPALETPDLNTQPMQAFIVRSGIGDAPCAEAPESGVYIQTPQGAGLVQFTVNGVDVSLGSGLFVQCAQDTTTLYLLYGTGTVRARGVSQKLQPGTRVVVPTENCQSAQMPPSLPEAYTNAYPWLRTLGAFTQPGVSIAGPAVVPMVMPSAAPNSQPVPAPTDEDDEDEDEDDD
jgi:hypothetical protein